MLKIYCKRCWLILEDIEIICLKKVDMCCGYAVVLSFCRCKDASFTTCTFDLVLLIMQHIYMFQV